MYHNKLRHNAFIIKIYFKYTRIIYVYARGEERAKCGLFAAFEIGMECKQNGKTRNPRQEQKNEFFQDQRAHRHAEPPRDPEGFL